LFDIVEAITKIERYAGRGKEAFERDELVQTWMVHHIQVIGEAASGLSPEFRQRRSAIPWREIIAMRNLLVHEYFGIDTRTVWNVVERDLPRLKATIQRLLDAPEKS